MSANIPGKPVSYLPITPRATLALNGLDLPGPLPTVRKAMHDMHEGQILLVISDFPAIEKDMLTWARHTHHQVLAVHRTSGASCEFYILKGDPWPVDATLDVRDLPCPTPVVRASKVLSALHSGQCVRLASTCGAAADEVTTWLKTTKHRLLGTTHDALGVYRFYIQKK
jgi:tRNA 2-thiouridine synthesizing protein A